LLEGGEKVWNARSLARPGILSGDLQQVTTQQTVLTCHDLSPLSSPAYEARWIFRARLYFVNGYVSDAIRCSGSADTATGGSAIAAKSAGLRPGGGNGAEPTAVISEARKAVSIIGTVNANTGDAAHA
jgi:hypothetical protein